MLSGKVISVALLSDVAESLAAGEELSVEDGSAWPPQDASMANVASNSKGLLCLIHNLLMA
jgi:hypothetical protein